MSLSPIPNLRSEGRTTAEWDMRIEGRHVTLITAHATPVPFAVCGLCSALVAIDDEGELRHLLFHSATSTIGGSGDRP